MVASVKQDRNHAENGLRGQAKKLGSAVTSEAKALKKHVAQTAQEVLHTVKDESTQFVRTQKVKAAERIENIVAVAHQAARVLEAGKIGKVAEYVDMAAEGAHEASKYLKESEVDQMANDLAGVVRRHPYAALGAMLVTGLTLSRFLRAGHSSASESTRGSTRRRSE